MRLDVLLKGINILEKIGDIDCEINGLSSDSREINEGYLFVAVKGSHKDGHNYLSHAINNGARALAVEDVKKVFKGITTVRLADTRGALSKMAARFYDYPDKGIDLIGITGTNGKTTTSYLLESILKESGIKTGVIGTINYRYEGGSIRSSLTTPDSTHLMRIMREMKDGGADSIIIEVSSHSLEQGRTRGLKWKRALFTNFSRDHLDYHLTMDNYFNSKALLFRFLGEGENNYPAKAIINMDDSKGEALKKITKVPVVSYGLRNDCMVRAADVKLREKGLQCKLVTPAGDIVITSALLGDINVYNILAAAAVAYSLEIGLKTISDGIRNLSMVPGRLQPVDNKKEFSIFVDYAHTPDAMEKTLKTLKQIKSGKLVTVFGCGGERDKGKRLEMGRVAGKLSDFVIITSDNPRGEDPQTIIDDIEPGVEEAMSIKEGPVLTSIKMGYRIIPDRKEAIKASISMIGKGDIVLIAGKGHEDYQIIGNRRNYFNDVEEASRAVEKNEAMRED